MKFCIKDFFSKCDQICSFLSIYILMHLSINVPFNLYFNVFVRLYVSCVLTTSSMNSKYYANVFHLGILANVSHSSNVNEVIKTILDFFIQKNSFLNGPKKLIFVLTFKRSQETSFCSYVWKYYYWFSGTTILLLFACSVLCFCLVACLCFWCFWCEQNPFIKK